MNKIEDMIRKTTRLEGTRGSPSQVTAKFAIMEGPDGPFPAVGLHMGGESLMGTIGFVAMSDLEMEHLITEWQTHREEFQREVGA